MGKIGNFPYPSAKISDSIDVVKLIEERFNGKVENQVTLSKVLGHNSVKSGGYIGKITALKRYGLISGRGELTTTQLGKRIVRPKDDEERMKSIGEAMENVELFNRIFERLGENPPTDDFWVDLVEITGEDRGIAQKDAIKIRNIYMDGYRYLLFVKKTELKGEMIRTEVLPSEIETRALSMTPVDALFELRTKDYGNLIVKDRESIEIARKLIDVIEQKLKSSKATKEEKVTKK